MIYCLKKLTVPVNFFLKEDTFISGSVSLFDGSSEERRAMLLFFIAFTPLPQGGIYVVFAPFIEGETKQFIVHLNQGIIPLINYSNLQKLNRKSKAKRQIHPGKP